MPPVVLAQLFQRHFWIPAFLALAAGFWLPGDYTGWIWSIPWQLGGILFCSCLKVRFDEVRHHLRDPGLPLRVGWLTAAKLLAIPIATWAVVRPVAPVWAPGIALITMMPAGLTSLAFTDLNRGNRVLALFLLVATSVACPITIPLLLMQVAPVGDGGVWVGVAKQAGYVLFLLAAPFIAAQMVRRCAAAFIDRHPTWWTQGAMMFSVLLAFTATAAMRPHWQHWSTSELMMPLVLTGVGSAIAGGTCWLVGRRVAPADAVAFACGALFVNNGLSVAFSTRFFPDDPRMVLPGVLNGVWMWSGMALLGAILHRRMESDEETLA